MAGFPDQKAIWLATVPGFANALFTIVGLILVDRIGRRKLLIGSISGTIFGLGLLAASFELMDHYSPRAVPLYSNGSCDFHSCGACVANSQCGFCADVNTLSLESFNGTCSHGGLYVNGTSYSNFTIDYNGTTLCRLHGEHPEGNDVSVTATVALGSGTQSLIPLEGAIKREWNFNSCPNNKLAALVIMALFLYIAFFAPGMGPLPWTINSEIYPTWARSTAIAIATSVNWISNLIVSMTFLTLTDHLGQPISFGVYAALGFLGLVFFVFLLPETKGKSLEEVEELFQQPYFTQWCGNKQSNCHDVTMVT